MTKLLGRPPRGSFVVVVCDEADDPVVIRSDPLVDDRTLDADQVLACQPGYTVRCREAGVSRTCARGP